MWVRPKISLSDYTYAIYPLVTLVTVVIISCRLANTNHHKRRWHNIPSPWSSIISFGDNYSDSGNGAHITEGKYPSEPYYWHHRFTNGPNWIDNLILDLGGLGKIKMRNFAHGGASSDNTLWQGNLLGHKIPGTKQQVRGFMLKSRNTGYADPQKTLYTIWTGANDCLTLGKGGNTTKFTVEDIQESIFQDILQMEHESHNKVLQVLVLTPPPIEDSPLVMKHEKREVQREVRRATERITHDLPQGLLNRFSKIGHSTMTNSAQLAPLHPPHYLPNHRTRAASPITHYITVDLPHTHTTPKEHNGGHPLSKAASPRLALHTAGNGIHQPMQKRDTNLDSAHKPAANPRGRLEIMVYDAYHFIKHASANPQCFDLDPVAVNQTCGERKNCYDRLWMDDFNMNTAVHYWMAHDINTRLHMWHLHTTGARTDMIFKNSTRAREHELETLGYACPMRAAPKV
ncbi:hypothetical protein LPJ66_002519 [Kickxella alabastrina]|uniref:Uncharacterized protein n=1 Tax=Kickxella alabastrina TaxID=61397 RepID=A0ACC1IQ93_9FUNG|nr:hypothetical protein LPJ66_002519 [Kickxella alabastrina]